MMGVAEPPLLPGPYVITPVLIEPNGVALPTFATPMVIALLFRPRGLLAVGDAGSLTARNTPPEAMTGLVTLPACHEFAVTLSRITPPLPEIL